MKHLTKTDPYLAYGAIYPAIPKPLTPKKNDFLAKMKLIIASPNWV
jgi:hypothetical protein